MAYSHLPCRAHRRSGAVVSTLALLAALHSHTAFAQVTVAGGATQAAAAANGVPVVNIATPNSAGLSHNTYTAYNVGSNGLVLNNTLAGSGGGQAQLAGLVAANANLTGAAAKVILNEVTSTNRSVLNGYTEVLGAKASVIVANPNGITCGGCGFINTANVTLTTGAPTFNADGSVRGFSVRGGDILINGTGLDATTLDYAALLGRKVVIAGPVNAQSLVIAGGSFDWDYAGQTATAVTPASAAPDYAIDTAVLGGMYANRVRLVATEAGVGVRVLGNAAASADDFSITASGQVQVGAVISAQRDLSIATTSSATGALTLTDAGLTAGRNLSFSATGGGAALNGGVLTSGGDFTLSAASLQDAADAATLANNNQRFAGGSMGLAIGGTAGLSGVSYGAAGALAGGFGSLSAAQSGSLYSKAGALSLSSTQGGLNLGAYSVTSANTLSLTAQGGAITTTAGTGQQVASTSGAVALQATSGLQNAGRISAAVGGVTLGVSGASINSGTISAGTDIALTDMSGGSAETFSNTGTAVAAGHIVLNAAAFQNAGGLQAGLGLTGWLGSLNNAGTLIASTNAASDGVLTVGALTNSGTLQSARNLTLTLGAASGNSGLVLAANALSLAGGGAVLTNQGGTLSAASANLTLAGLTNSGTVQTSGDMVLSLGGALANTVGTAKVVAGGALTSASQTLSNAGTVQSSGAAQVTATGAVTNNGVLFLGSGAGASGTLTVGALDNQAGAYIQSSGDVAITAKGATVANAGSVIATGNLTITGQGTALALTNASGGYLQASDTGTLTIGGTNVSLANGAGGTLNAGKIALTLASATNAGFVNAKTDLGYTIAGDLGNSGTILARGLLTGTSGSFTNLTGGGVQGATGLTLVATGAFANDGQVLGDPAGTADVSVTAGTLSNTTHGVIQSPRNLTVTVTGATLDNAGLIASTSDLKIHGSGAALALSNTDGGFIQAKGVGATTDTLTVDGAAVTLTNAANASIVGDHLAVTAKSLTNQGVLAGLYGANTVAVAATLTNSGKLVLSTDSGAGVGIVTAATLANGVGGTVQSSAGLTLSVSQALTNSATISAVTTLTVQTGTSTAAIQNTGSAASITAGGALTISGANSTLATDAGSKASGATVDLTLASLTNAGAVLSGGAFHYALGAGLTNASGASLGAVGALTGTSGALVNAGAIQANGAASLRASTIQNQVGGSILSLADLSLLVSGGSLVNAGFIYGARGVTISGLGSSLAITNDDTGDIETDTSGSGALTIDGAAVSLDNQSGVDAHGAAIAGKILSAGLSLNLSSLTNSGAIQSTGVGKVTTLGALNNSGRLIVSGDGDVGTVTTQTLNSNAGSLLRFGTGTLNVHDPITNAGSIVAVGDLTVHSTDPSASTLTNGAATGAQALIQSGGALILDNGASVANGATGAIVADLLSFNLANFTNSGLIQGGRGGDLWGVGAFVNNAGGTITLNTRSGATSTIFADSFDNNGLLQALGSIGVQAASHIGQAATGSILANGDVSLYTQSGPLTFAPAGTIAAGGLLSIGAGSGGGQLANLSLALADGASLYGGTVAIDAPSVTIGSGAGTSISSGGALTLSTDSLTFTGVKSRILAALGGSGDAAITVRGSGGFTNPGLIYSADTLHLTTANGSIVNAATGGISAGNGLAVTAVSGDITNSGELYGGNSVVLVADANRTITNAYNGATNLDQAAFAGSIDSGGSITATAGTFINNSQINASGDITVSAATFKNATIGDWSKQSTTTDTGGSYTAPVSYLFGPSFCLGPSLPCRQSGYLAYVGATTTTESFSNGYAQPKLVPQIVASGTLTIKDFSSGTNYGAILSGASVILQGGANAQFIENDDFTLKKTVVDYQYFYPVTYTLLPGTVIAQGFTPQQYQITSQSVDTSVRYCDTGSSCTNSLQTTVTNVNTPTNTGVFAGNLTATGFNLVSMGSAQTVHLGTAPTGSANGAAAGTPTSITIAANSATNASVSSLTGPVGASAASVTGATVAGGLGTAAPAPQTLTNPISSTTVNGRTAITISGVTITLPSNPNGLFVTTPSPSSSYLVETNPLYTNPTPVSSTSPTSPTTPTVSSTDLAAQLGVETIAKRLGDASYEAYLIGQQLLGQTGRSILSSYANQQSELTSFYAAAADEAKVQGLEWGKPLSDVQVADLKSDIVWMVTTKVNGQDVLAPVVYLSAATKAALTTGSGIIADNVDANLASLNNQGGAIVGAQTNRIVTTGALINGGGGTIAGDQVVVQALKGPVVNSGGTINGTTLAAVSGDTGVINTSGGSITGAQVVVQSLNGGVDNSGGKIVGSTFAAVQAKGDIVNQGGAITGGDVSLTSTKGAVDLNGGTVAAGGLLAVSTLKDININKPTALSGHDISLTSTGGDINVVTQTKTVTTGPYVAQGSGLAGVLAGGGNYTTEVGPTAGLRAGGSLSLNAAKDVNVQGGNLSAGNNIALIAGDKLTIGTVADREASAGVSKQGNTTTTSATGSVTQLGSNITAGGTVYTKSGGDTSITGSTIQSGSGTAIIAGGRVDIVGATDSARSSSTAVQKTSTAGIATSNTQKASSASTTNVASNITSFGDVTIVSGKDTNIVGSKVAATGDLGILSGGKVTIAGATDTLHTTSDYSAKGVTSGAHNSSDVSSTTNAGSTLSGGGNVAILAKGDVTLAGSALNAGKDAYIDTNGNKLNVVAATDTTNTNTFSSKSGLGVNGGLYGSNKTTTTDAETRNAASNITTGGNLVSTGNQSILIQGSTINVAGSGALTAKNGITIADGADTSHKTSHSESETVFGASNKTTTSLSTGASANASGKTGSASASASAGAKASDSSTVSFYDKTVTDTASDSSKSVASNVKFGGDALIDAGKGDLTVKGSNVAAGGDLYVKGQSVSLLAGQNTATTSSKTDSKTFGVFTDVNANAQASASASVKPQAGQAGADAGASVGATVTSTLGFRSTTSQSSSDTLTNTGSTLTAGKNLTLDAADTLLTQGATLKAGGVVTESAKTISNLAATDHDYSSSKSSSVTAGLFVEGKGSASVSGTANASAGMGIGASAAVKGSAGASVTGTAGVRVANSQSSSDSGTTTARTTSIDGGQGIVRIASGALTDQGTQLTSGGNIDQSAKTVQSLAATNTAYGDKASLSNEARFGGYATAGAKASGGASAGAGAQSGVQVSVEATAGVAASDTFAQSNGSNRSSTAVVTNYNAAGKINTTSTEGSTFEGANLNGAQGVNISASKVDFTAAQNTSTQSSDSHNASASVRVGLVGKSDLDVQASYSQDKGSQSTSDAVVGSIRSGSGAVNIKTTNGDATLVGTQVEGAKGVNVDTKGGALNVLAAQSTTNFSTETASANAGVTASKGAGGVSLGAGYSRSDGQQVVNTVSNIKSSGGAVNLVGDKGVTLQGANVDGATGAHVAATTGGVKLVEALDTTKVTGGGAGISVSGDTSTKYAKSGDGPTQAVSTSQSGSEAVNFSVQATDYAKGKAVSITSGGVTSVQGGQITDQGATINGAKGTHIDGAVTNKAVTSRDINVDTGASVTASYEKTVKAPTTSTNPTNGAVTRTSIPTVNNPLPKSIVTSTPNKTLDPNAASTTDSAVTKTPVTSKPETTFAPNSGSSVNGAVTKTPIPSQTKMTFGPNSTSVTETAFNTGVVKTPVKTVSTDVPKAPAPTPATPAVAPPTTGLRSIATTALSKGFGTNPEPSGAPSVTPTAFPATAAPTVNPYANPYAKSEKFGTDGSPTILAITAPSSSTAAPVKPAGVTAKPLVTPKAKAADPSTTSPTTAIPPAGSTPPTAPTIPGAPPVLAPVTFTPPNLQAPAPGKTVSAATPSGAPLPAWLQVNPLTGQITGTPPAAVIAANAPVTVVVSVPQSDGTTRKATLTLSPDQFVGKAAQ